jgi:hypothetical protein
LIAKTKKTKRKKEVGYKKNSINFCLQNLKKGFVPLYQASKLGELKIKV